MESSQVHFGENSESEHVRGVSEDLLLDLVPDFALQNELSEVAVLGSFLG